MKSFFFLSLLSLSVFAETFEYKIEGMSCSGCKAMIKSAVCTLPGIKDCTVEIGSMKLTSEEGKTLDQDSITQALNKLNEKNKEVYQIASSKKIEAEASTIIEEKAPTEKAKKTTKKADKK